MALTIYTNNHIAISGTQTELAVFQQPSGTVVYNYETGEKLNMPRTHYTLATEAGRAEFEEHAMFAMKT
jgi:hypothetical protein